MLATPLGITACEAPFRGRVLPQADFREGLIEQFRTRLAAGPTPVSEHTAEAAPGRTITIDDTDLQAAAWWEGRTRGEALTGADPREATLTRVLERTLAHSSQIRVFSDIPLIRQTAVAEARGRFVPRFFAEGKFDRSNEPVGSTLQTGGDDRFIEDAVVGEIGVRKRFTSGADVTLSQRLAYVDNNSVFFVPNPQARAALTLSVVQPLLRGAGAEYNQSVIRIAEIDGDVAQQEFLRQSQTHLLEVSRAYWSLYLSRALYLQQQRLVAETEGLLAKLEGRAAVDAGNDVLVRARASASQRRSDLIRSELAIRNGEDRLRSLVNDPELYAAGVELLTVDPPSEEAVDVDLVAAAEAALMSRPEVAQAFDQWRAAAIRLGMAHHETLPQLDLIAQAAAVGLDGANGDEAFGDQFDNGGISYMIGLRFEDAIGDAESDARLLRRRLELRQQSAQVQTTIETVLLEVRVSVREVRTAYRDLQSRRDSLLAAREDARVLRRRFDEGVDISGTGGVTFLQLLLDAQARLTDAESAYVRAQAAYAVSLANLQRAQGTLLKYENLEVVRGDQGGEGGSLPTLEVRPIADEPAAADADQLYADQLDADQLVEVRPAQGGDQAAVAEHEGLQTAGTRPPARAPGEAATEPTVEDLLDRATQRVRLLEVEFPPD